MKRFQFFIPVLILLMSSSGCEKQDFGGFGIDAGAVQVYFPNVINPTNENNRIFYPQVVTEDPDLILTVEFMEIFDRLGNSVYRVEQFPPNDRSFGWDGTYEGKFVEPGTFNYSVSMSNGAVTEVFRNTVLVAL